SGDFRDIKVTTLYLTDLKNEINRILGDYKRQQEGFANAINNGTQYTNEFSFEVAESYLNSAKSFSNGGSEHRNKISELEKLIAAKKSEKEETEKKERQEAGSKKVSSSTGGGSSESGGNSDDAEEESTSKNRSSQKKYIPKTATQMHNELKAMAAQNPRMMDAPNFRQRLRHLEVDANREQQTLREYRSGANSHGNYQAMAAQIATNQRVDTYTKAAGDVTDAVASIVTGILAEHDRKKEQRRLQIQADINNYNAKRDALRSYHDEMSKERTTYTTSIEQE